jgi:two-component system, cell cycle sensor histidine kinase and response regulator CckA
VKQKVARVSSSSSSDTRGGTDLPVPPASVVRPVFTLVALLSPVRWVIALVGVAALAAGALAADRVPGMAALAAGCTLLLLALASAIAQRKQRADLELQAQRLSVLTRHDPEPILITASDGRILARNAAAVAGGREAAEGLSGILATWCADPDAVVTAMIGEARARGHATRDFTRPGDALRVAAMRIEVEADEPAAEGLLLWRFARGTKDRPRAVDALGLPVLTLGPDGAPVAANASMRRYLDWTPADGAAPPEAVRTFLTEGLGGIAPGSSRTVRLPVGGETIVCLAFAVSGHDGQLDIVLLPLWLSAQARAPTERPDFDDLPVALMQLAPDGRIEATNRLARMLLGLAPGEERFFWEVVEGLGRPVADWFEDARAGRALNRPEVLAATLPAQETFVQITLRRAAGPGAEQRLVAVLTDATELKSLEARFVQSQKMQAIGQLAGGVAHDFNNLLTAISGHCDLLLLNRDHFDPDYADLMQIQQNSNRAAALVRQLLAFSRKQTLKPELLSLESLLEELTHLLTRLVGERITLTLDHDASLGRIRADRQQLEQVIMNLVVNARDAMPMGGEIRIETRGARLESDTELGGARLARGDYAVIRVIDEGVGIPADLIEKVFEPFFTTKRTGEGTGLGLSTAYGIVKQMGGYIFADSVEGAGTTFSIYFAMEPGAAHSAPEVSAEQDVAALAQHPDTGRRGQVALEAVAGAPPAPVPTLLPAEAPAGAPRLDAIVLLVEDEAPVRAFAARALRMQGYQVIEAESGEQALDYLADPDMRVDIFVTDVIMPGLDGPGWVAEAIKSRPGTPVVFISGYTEDTVSAGLARTPRSVFLGKPFSLEQLSTAIGAQLAEWPRSERRLTVIKSDPAS